MFQKLLSSILIAIISLAGIIVTIFPFTSGEKAYYVNDKVYINIKDSVDMGYNPFLRSMLQKKQSSLAFEEKKALREQYTPLIDSLSTASLDAKLSKDFLTVEKISIRQKELSEFIREKEFDIEDKYSLNQLGKQKYQAMYEGVKADNSLIDYVVAVAAEQIIFNDNQKITAENITIKKVNKQSKTPFLLSGFFILGCAVFLYFYQSGDIALHKPTTKYIVIGSLLVASIIMISKIYSTFSDRISFDNTLAERESIVKEKLLTIRTAELNYYEAKNKYCNNWDELIRFYKNDSIKIVKYLVNKNDTAAVNLALKNGLAIEEIEMIPSLDKAFPNQKIDLKNIAYVPFSDNPFEINAGIVDKNGRNIHVFEVKTSKYDFVKELSTLPENFDKDKSLIIGSMNEPTTESNW
ncbi:MAG: hypothetical protein ACJAZ2_000850 [Glaciecola sp.]|jgi:hypothetical protein